MYPRIALDPAQLRTRRIMLGLSQKALATRAGIHPISLTRYETGSMTPRPDTFARLALALGCQVSDIAVVVPNE
jgi:transcriptional regulator with XRE-family HTH domain